MEDPIRNRVGICGLYCGTCPYFLAPRIGDTDMMTRFSQEKGIPAEALRCDGCLSDRVSDHCVDCRHGFRECAAAHGVTWCFQCGDFPCERLEGFRDVHVVNGVSHHARVIEDLREIKGGGMDAWVEKQEADTRCPTCGRALYWFDPSCPDCNPDIR